jgi:hypothetical protein
VSHRPVELARITKQAPKNTLVLTNEEIVERYAAKLKSEGIAGSEIAFLEADYWNRYYTDSNANFNKAPNAFLMKMVEGRPPGAALDDGMGEGRNAIYLASLVGRCGDSIRPMQGSH